VVKNGKIKSEKKNNFLKKFYFFKITLNMMFSRCLKIVDDKIQDQNNPVLTEIIKGKCQYLLKRGSHEGKYCGKYCGKYDAYFCSIHATKDHGYWYV
jgi:hypothetical protein